VHRWLLRPTDLSVNMHYTPCCPHATMLLQLTWDVFEARYGNGRGAVPLLFIPAVGLFFCAFTSMASNGR
jgi:hypothetical protein